MTGGTGVETYLLGQGGYAALLFAACSSLGGVIAFLYRQLRAKDDEHEKERAAWDAQRLAFFEARLSESLRVQTALEANTRALMALEQSSVARAAAIASLSHLMGALTDKTETRYERYSAMIDRFDARLEHIDRSQEQTQRSLDSLSRSFDRPRPHDGRRA